MFVDCGLTGERLEASDHGATEEVSSWLLKDWTESTKTGKDCTCPGQESNQSSPKYKSVVL